MVRWLFLWICAGSLVMPTLGLSGGRTASSALAQGGGAGNAPTFGAPAAGLAAQDDDRPGRGERRRPHGGDRIREENQRPGTTRWQSEELRQTAERRRDPEPRLRDRHDERHSAPGGEAPRFGAGPEPGSAAAPDSGSPAGQSDTWVDTPIRGYADQASVNRGGTIRFMVSTSRPRYDVEVYRMGWYGGTGGRLMHPVQGLPGQNQPVPTPQSGTGLIAASWQPSYTLQTGIDWVSGVYLAKLIASTGEVSYILFVLRDDGDPADVLYQVPLTTYQAYNNWGGKSLYPWQSSGNSRAYKVSFDRPYANWSGAGDFFEGDYNMIRWLESQGYDLTYATNVDLHSTPGLLANRKVFLSNWHDEYWSKQMRDNITAARDQGKHLAFFDSNNIFWQIRFEPNASGVPNRVVVCYKEAAHDPMSATNPSLVTVTWRDPYLNQPENALLGVMWESQFNFGTSYPWVVSNASHWVYNGTGLQNGQSIPGLVGFEYDKVWNNGHTPANLQVLAASPVVDFNNRSSTANGSIYTAASGAMVFTAGTNYWAWKLDDNEYRSKGADARVQRMTANTLASMISGIPGTPPSTATPNPVTTPLPAGTLYSWDTPGDLQGWQRGSGAVSGLGQSNTQASMGSGSLEVTLALGGSGGTQGGVAVYPSPPQNWSSHGTTLRAQAYTPANAPAGLQAQLVLQDGSWSWSPGPWVTLAPGSWQEVRYPNAPLAQVAGAWVMFQGTSYSGKVYVDAFQVVAASTLTPTGTATRTATATAPPSATATAMPTASPTNPAVATATPTPARTALVSNGSFESATTVNGVPYPADWQWRSTATRDATIAHSGTASLKVTGPATAVYTFQHVPLQPATTYTLQFWVKTDNVTGQGVMARYAQLQPQTVVWNSAWTNGTTDWKQVTTTFTTPADYVSGRLDLLWTLNAGEVAWFDDVVLSDTTPPSTPTATLPTPTATATALSTATSAPTATTLAATPTATGTATATPTALPSATATPAATATATATRTATPPATATQTATATATRTPTATATRTATPTTTTAGQVLFDWETPGDTQNWVVEGGDATGVAQSTAQHQNGSGALAIQANYRGGGWQDLTVARHYSSAQNLAGGTGTLTGWVYLPAGAPNDLAAELGLIDGSNTRRTSPRATLSPGSWVKVTWANAPLTAVRGITVTVGGQRPRYTGPIYVDYIVVE